MEFRIMEKPLSPEEIVNAVRRSQPEYNSQMEQAKRLLSVIEEVCINKNWDLKTYFRVHPQELWNLQETAGLSERTGYQSRTGRRPSAD
jgi:hypothetical protein